MDLTTTKAYKSGQIILQDKASCFPAYLLNPGSTEGDKKSITVKAKQDFMRLDPSAKEYRNVTALLLDPSCSAPES
ncbi:hypothetical protein BTJ68_09939 [Hortaea werneckii EXF-2000]|uniref:Uncharacterized protein n=1 Tax=Hortaea werneckii EXF-2000 TaxID=1157616 RepID=A0A1Z5T0L4_HORWE|nr:hypothetical protein BTJ68_09939 [Hortaea werneckii EXF-2000]